MGPRQALLALENWAGGHLLSRASQDDDCPPVIKNIVVSEEGQVFAIGREAKVFDRMIAVENLSDRIFHLAHSLRR